MSYISSHESEIRARKTLRLPDDSILRLRKATNEQVRKLRTTDDWLTGRDRSGPATGTALGLIAEIHAKHLARYLVQDSDFFIWNTHPDLDSPQGDRGFDILVSKKGPDCLTPVCGLDVTIANPITERDLKIPGVNYLLDIPVFVVYMRQLYKRIPTVDMNFGDYVRRFLRPAINAGEYNAFIGLDEVERSSLLIGLRREISWGIHNFENTQPTSESLREKVILSKKLFGC